jgi:hypothetical protein
MQCDFQILRTDVALTPAMRATIRVVNRLSPNLAKIFFT